MKCPKCNNSVPDNATVCPHCHKVFLLECPNCHALSDVAVCEKCGYILLIKCAKCGKSVSTSKDKCKCGFPIHTSIAYNECENDEFSAISVQFLSLQKIRHLLGSQELFTKFYFKLRNLLVLQLKDLDATVINYNDAFVINMNKELSFPTSAAKALRLAIKIVNSFAEINTKLQDELSIPLKLNDTVTRKKAEELLE